MLPCLNCTLRKKVVGDAHSQCTYPHTQELFADIMSKASAHGIKKGWFRWPYNYDPVWGPDACIAYSPTGEANGATSSKN